MNWRDRRALVCAGSRGIGAAAVRLLAGQGAEVHVWARSIDSLQSLKTSTEGRVSIKAIDLTQHDVVNAAIAQLIESSGPVHIVVNNMAGPKGGPLVDASPQSIAIGIHQHVLLAQIIMQAVLPGMKEEGFGRFLNIISTSVKAPIPGLGVSNTVRGAMANWAKSLSLEVAPFGITVNNVLPGFTSTDRLAKIITSRAEKSGQSTSEIEAAMRASVPMKRFAHPDEVAAALVFLASPDAGYITGINLPVDGGRTPSL